MAEDLPEPKSESRQNIISDMYFGTAERTVAESAYVPDSYVKPWNPDDLYQRKGDYSIYEDMLKDDQVAVAMQLKKDLVVGSGWNITTEKDGDSNIADDIYQRLEEDVDISFEDQLEELIDNSYSYGFALSEKLFKYRDDNTLTFSELRTRHPHSWLIHTDQHGRVTKYEQRSRSANLDIDPKSLIHMINNRRWQNPYGRSDLRSAYEAWMTKRHIIRFYSIFLEKNASPTPVAKYAKNVPTATITKIFNIIKRFQTKTAIVVPKEFEIDFLESKSNGEAYVKGINLFNMFIGRSLTIPDLLGFSGSESSSGGSQALGREQMSIFMKHIMRRRRSLERIVNKHIVQPLVTYNYGDVDLYPKFVLNPISDQDGMEFAKVFLQAINGKAYKPNEEEINHFRYLIKFPEGDVDFHEPISSPFQPGPRPGFRPKDDLDGIKDDSDLESDDVLENLDKLEKDSDSKKKLYRAYNQPEGKFYKRFDADANRSLLEANHKKLLAVTSPITDMIIEDLKNQIRKKKILGDNPKPDRIRSLRIQHTSKLNLAMQKAMKEHFKDSRLLARNELPKKDFTEPLPSEDFLKFLEGEIFQYIGTYRYLIDEFTARQLRNAIKDGLPLSTVESILDDEGRRLLEVSLERYSRTKHTEIMNRGRLAEFKSSGVVPGYQYSAILDGRTTEICRGLHGKQFKEGTQPIPPMHFNCRSVLIPITIFDDPKDVSFLEGKDLDKTDKFIDRNIGAGFSRR